jgi:two-component system, OmpR family, response regulator
LIEDDRRVVRFVRRGLEAEGFAVDVAKNGEDGIELCRSHEYDVVLLDRMLPGMDGMEVCDSLRRERRPCVILMLTAKDSLQNKVEGLHAGADDYPGSKVVDVYIRYLRRKIDTDSAVPLIRTLRGFGYSISAE